jgi:hypothetical protein
MNEIDKTRVKLNDFSFTHNGIGFTITIPVYSDVKAILSDNTPYQEQEISKYYLEYLKSTLQRKYLDDLLEKIQGFATNQNDLARIAISLVQRIPYDTDKVTYDLKYNPFAKIRYPYEVIFDNKGICCEKSLLLAFLLKELGFGVVLFLFHDENHMAMGIKSPSEFGNYNTQYAFVETTIPSIVTDTQGTYLESTKLGIFRNKLKSIPSVIHLCEGNSFTGVYVEFHDAKEWNELNEKYRHEDGYYFNRRLNLIRKYGF